VCVQAHTNQAVNTNGNNAYWEIIASGANLPGQTGNAGKALKTDGTNLSWGDGGGVIQTFRKDFNTWYSYGGNGSHMSCYDFNLSGLTVGNKLVIHMQFFGESHHDRNIRVQRNGAWIPDASGSNNGGHPNGIYTPNYDQNEDSTPNLGHLMFIDDIVSTSQNYTFYTYGNSQSWHVNRCYNSSYEKGRTYQVAMEVTP